MKDSNAVAVAILSALPLMVALLLWGTLGKANAARGDLGTWNYTTSLTTARWAFAGAATPHHVYVAGGEEPKVGGGITQTAKVQRAAINSDGTLGAWVDELSLPAVDIDQGTAIYNNRIYVAGGWGPPDWSMKKDVWYADIQSDGSLTSWITATSMTYGRAHLGFAAADGCLFAIGGYTSTAEAAPILPDGSDGAWQIISSPIGIGDRGFAANGFLYSTGGTTIEYAPIGSNCTAGAWSSTSPPNQGRREHAALANPLAG